MSELVSVPLELLDVSPDQNRTVFDADYLAGLARSISENGLLTPIVVRRSGDRFVLVAGECRTRAARIAGLTSLPAHVVDVDDAAALIGTLIENVTRSDPDPIDEAAGYRRALNLGAVQDVGELARRLGIQRSRVERRLALLALGDLAQSRVRAGDLKLTYAGAMIGLDPNRQLLALHAYQHVPTPPIDAFRLLCDRMRDDQAAEGMSLLDGDAFLKVEEWARELAPVPTDVTGPVGVREIGAALGIDPKTVHKFRQRHADFPAPSGSVSGTPWWNLAPVLDWARATGRLISA